MGFTSLNQHLDLAWLREAYRRTRKDGAAGVDGQTAADYEKDLEGNLRSLLERAKSGTYRAPPVRRVSYPERHRRRDSPHRDSDAGGQSAPAGGRDAAGADLRAGLLCLLVWVPAGTIGARCPGSLWKQTMWSGVAGSWRWTSASFSTRWIMPTCGSFSNTGYATVWCYD